MLCGCPLCMFRGDGPSAAGLHVLWMYRPAESDVLQEQASCLARGITRSNLHLHPYTPLQDVRRHQH